MEDFLSDIERTLYDYITEKVEVTFNDIKKDLGDKYLGASGKLIQKDLVERSKKKITISAFPGVKYLKTLKIKGVK